LEIGKIEENTKREKRLDKGRICSLKRLEIKIQQVMLCLKHLDVKKLVS